jgi:purine-cytosine permease-like protein
VNETTVASPDGAEGATANGRSATIRSSRRFNKLVASETMEDYSLRYAPRSFRRWSEYVVASTALGGIAYLADYAIGGSIFVTQGFSSGLWAVVAAAVIIFLTGVPIAYYAAKYAIDMDLLTRGAGFGYLGSTITSLIYATFTFIFFSLEGSIMAQALQSSIGLPLPAGYLIVALAIIPLVVFGMTFLSKMQVVTQPIWVVLMIAPIIAVLVAHPHSLAAWTHFGGKAANGSSFNLVGFGLGAGVALSLIAQIGEQVDYLRFLPPKTPDNRRRWWSAVLTAGPGWVVLGAIKQMAGGFLAFFVFHQVGASKAVEPIIQVLGGYQVFVPGAALAIAAFYVILSQIKINVTNAYSGSLSWSNFFSRVFHTHPGRVVWIFFNVGIALGLMEGGVFGFLNSVLGFYSNVAIAWIGAVVADLVVNKPLKLSPSYIEFKRAHLYSVNPVGFGSMLVASAVSIAAYFHAFGQVLYAFSPFLALAIAFIMSPLLAIVTRGKYYIAREDILRGDADSAPESTLTCVTCEQDYELPDMAQCPFHGGVVCSLCCTLEKDCHDACKQPAAVSVEGGAPVPVAAP